MNTNHLILAAESGNLDDVKALLTSSLQIDVINGEGRSALFQAARFGYVEIVLVLVSAGANVNLRDNDLMTPLHLATEAGQLAVVEALVAVGAQTDGLSAQYRGNCSPLQLAVQCSYSDIVKVLIKASNEASLLNDFNNGILHVISSDNSKIVQLLLEVGANIERQEIFSKRTALQLHVEFNRFECVFTLIEADADVGKVRGIVRYTIEKILQLNPEQQSRYLNVILQAGVELNFE